MCTHVELNLRGQTVKRVIFPFSEARNIPQSSHYNGNGTTVNRTVSTSNEVNIELKVDIELTIEDLQYLNRPQSNIEYYNIGRYQAGENAAN